MLKFVSVALRLRYIIPATAVGGYYSVKRKYEDVKSQLPEMPDFIKNLFESGRGTLESIDLDSWTASLNESAQTFNDWLDEASAAMKTQTSLSRESRKCRWTPLMLPIYCCVTFRNY